MTPKDFLNKAIQDEKARACMDIALNSREFAQKRTFNHFETLFADYDTATALTARVYSSITCNDIEDAKQAIKNITL